jgi:signal transduction histidine kinase
LVTHLFEQYAERWSDRKLSLTTDVTSADVFADAELLRLAVRQLLDNARKYSTWGAAIKVGVELQQECVAVRVWNGGSPIASNERAKIFERFYRGTEVRQTVPGSGLGLYVARKIAQAHGGSLDLEANDAFGSEGTTFRMTIPLAKNDSDHADKTA